MSITEKLNQHDCWDLGGGVNSMEWAAAHYGISNPLAINPGDEYGRVDDMINQKHPVLQMSAVDLPEHAQTDVIAMSHMLEHVESKDDRINILNYSIDHARKMVVVMGPYFRADDELREKEMLKFNWADWIDHKSRYDLFDIIDEVLDKRSMKWGVDFTISLGHPALAATDPNVFNISEPSDQGDQGDYDAHIHLPKPGHTFLRPYYKEFMLIVRRSVSLQDCARMHRARHPGFQIFVRQ